MGARFRGGQTVVSIKLSPTPGPQRTNQEQNSMITLMALQGKHNA